MFSKITSRISKPFSVFDKLGFGSKFEFRSKPSLITVICMDRHSPNKLFATKYCFIILGNDSSFFSLIISLFFVFFLLFYVILLLLIFTKTLLLLSLYLIFFHEITFIFSCSGMFRHVPECSVFRVLSTPHSSFNLFNLKTCVKDHGDSSGQLLQRGRIRSVCIRALLLAAL